MLWSGQLHINLCFWHASTMIHVGSECRTVHIIFRSAANVSHKCLHSWSKQLRGNREWTNTSHTSIECWMERKIENATTRFVWHLCARLHFSETAQKVDTHRCSHAVARSMWNGKSTRASTKINDFLFVLIRFSEIFWLAMSQKLIELCVCSASNWTDERREEQSVSGSREARVVDECEFTI